MNFRELADTFCKTTKLNVEDVIAQGGCTIRFQDSLDVSIEWEEATSSLCIYANVIKVPESGQAELFALLLRTHLFGAATQGALFGLHRESNQIMLFKKVNAENLSEIECLQMLEQFVQQTAFWTLQLNTSVVTA